MYVYIYNKYIIYIIIYNNIYNKKYIIDIYIYMINIYVIYNTYNILYIPHKLCIELQQSVQLVEWFTSNKS